LEGQLGLVREERERRERERERENVRVRERKKIGKVDRTFSMNVLSLSPSPHT
jgi:hypothetical protein